MENDLRCTECGAIVDETVRGLMSKATDARFAPLDPRYRTAWCPWHRRSVVAVRAASVAEAVHHDDRTTPDADQLKGPWS